MAREKKDKKKKRVEIAIDDPETFFPFSYNLIVPHFPLQRQTENQGLQSLFFSFSSTSLSEDGA
jgi:hypothetical protein